MNEILKQIKENYLLSFLKIPNTTARLFDKNLLNKLKTNKDDVGEQEEKNDLMEEESLDSIISSSSENESDILNKLKTKIKNKKISIDLFNGKNAEHLLINRVDRDIFELNYHNKLKSHIPFDLYNKNKIILSSDYFHFKKYCEELYKVEQFCHSLSIKLTGEYDFIINNVNKTDIDKVLSDESKKYFVFGDKTLFEKDVYDIYGEVTINLFRPSNYIHKLKQLIKYIILIKLFENHPQYFKLLGIKNKNRAIMFVTDGKYNDFIEKLSESKIFSEDFGKENKEFKSDSIEGIIKCKKYKEEIDEFKKEIEEIKNNNNKFIELLKGDNLEEIKKNYENHPAITNNKNIYSSLKLRTINILRILKLSKIPFIICYFPKIGEEFPYYLFKDKAIFIEKNKTKDGNYQYQFKAEDLKSEYLSKTELNDKYVSKDELNNNYISKTELNDKYVSKDELKNNYISKTELNDKYVSKDELNNNYISKTEFNNQINELVEKKMAKFLDENNKTSN